MASLSGVGVVAVVSISALSPAVAAAATRPTFAAAFEHRYADAWAVGDFNGDRVPDIAGAANAIWVQSGQGDGNFRRPSFSRSGLRGACDLRRADLNHDGHPDLLVEGATNCHLLSVLLNDGRGHFRRKRTYAIHTNELDADVIVVDVNGDRLPDLVNGDFGPRELIVRLGTGSGTFGPRRFFRGPGIFRIATGDLNGDGHPDLAFTTTGRRPLGIRFGEGHGNFGADRFFGKGQGYAVAVADVNHDRKPDVLLAHPNNRNVAMRLGRGDGSFRRPRMYGIQEQPDDIIVADFNGDGNPDLLTDVISGYAGMAFRPGRGNGAFGRRRILYPSIDFGGVVGDLNRDGRPDLVGDPTRSPGYVNGLEVLLNTTGMRRPPCVVPPILRDTLDVAERALEQAACRTGAVTRRYSPTVRPNRVISERPRWGTVQPYRGAVELALSGAGP